VLRVLGNVLDIAGFDYDSSEQVRDEVMPQGTEFVEGLSNAISGVTFSLSAPETALQRVTDVPIYFADALVRRAAALQQTSDAAEPVARMSAATLANAGLADGAAVRIKQGQGEALLNARVDETVPAGCIRIPAAHASTASLGDMFGPINVERA
jgi:NADH-quinone oxidoreductase subunit G